MAVIGIYYDGGNTYDDDGNVIENDIIYHKVNLHTRSGDFDFTSGDFIKDWYFAKRKYAEIQDDDTHFSHSSSVDHFMMDGAKYTSAYLHFESDEKPVLKYLDRSDPNWVDTQFEIYENGWEFFVPYGTHPTWEELKAYCNSEDERK